MLKVLSSILCDLDLKVKAIGQKAGICDGVPSTSALVILADICRVCRCEGSSDKPLYHPCVCTGSIKFIHQACSVIGLDKQNF